MSKAHSSIVPGTPFTLKNGTALKNRLVKSAMSEQLGDAGRNPAAGMERLYRAWADGGAGLLISGNIMVDRRFISEPKNVVLDDESDLAAFRRWTASTGTTPFWAQLNHPGKQVPNIIAWEPVAPSAIGLKGSFQTSFNKPRALKEQEILDIVEMFARCAKLAKQVGFGGVQIHGAHGYLINQFLSPLHNQREDRWGGSLENRMRFVLEVYRAIRNAVGKDYPVAIKLNSADFMAGGFTESDSMQVVEALSRAGIDLIEVSGGTYESQAMSGANVAESTQKREAYFLSYAEEVRRRVNTPLMVTGGFRSGGAMSEALQSSATDLIGLSRPLAVDPAFPNKILERPDHRIVIDTISTGIKALDRLVLLNITWYEHQLAFIARGQSPRPHLSAWRSLLATLSSMGTQAFVRRRA